MVREARRSDSARTAERRPVARLQRPGELVAVVPMLCGFVPSESVVVLALHGPRCRVGLTMRVDLPDPPGEASLIEEVLERLARDGAGGALVVVYTAGRAPDGQLPRSGLVSLLTDGCRRTGRVLHDALLVRDGRWWSYVCADESCCPADGTVLEVKSSTAVGLVAAEQVLDGRVVLPSRADLAASLAPPVGHDPAAAAAAVEQAEQARLRQVAAGGRAVTGQTDLLRWREAVRSHPAAGDAVRFGAALVASLTDVLVRDEVLTWALEDDGDLLSLLLSLARSCGPPADAPVCTVLAWVAHVRGDGALANVALDRALSSDPSTTMAQLGRQALDAQVSPARVRELLRECRRALRREHPWTGCHSGP